MESYEAFHVENAGMLFRSGADELDKVLDSDRSIVLGKVAVCADKIDTFSKKSRKEFDSSVAPEVRDRVRVHLERELKLRIRNSGHLWEILRAAVRHMNDIHHAPKIERQRARAICTAFSELFP